jgi:hypothetical protein
MKRLSAQVICLDPTNKVYEDLERILVLSSVVQEKVESFEQRMCEANRMRYATKKGRDCILTVL